MFATVFGLLVGTEEASNNQTIGENCTRYSIIDSAVQPNCKPRIGSLLQPYRFRFRFVVRAVRSPSESGFTKLVKMHSHSRVARVLGFKKDLVSDFTELSRSCHSCRSGCRLIHARACQRNYARTIILVCVYTYGNTLDRCSRTAAHAME